MSHFVAPGSHFGTPFLSQPCRTFVALRYDKLRHNATNSGNLPHSPVQPRCVKLLIVNVYNEKSENLSIFAFRTPSGARTLDPNIKSVVLYQLS